MENAEIEAILWATLETLYVEELQTIRIEVVSE